METDLAKKMADMDIPGAMIEFDPDEADEWGFFVEEALTAAEAIESALDSAEVNNG